MCKNKWLKIIVTIVSPLLSIVGLNIFNIPAMVFTIIIFILIAYILKCVFDLYRINNLIKVIAPKTHKIADKISKLQNENGNEDEINFQKKKYQKKKNQKSKLYKNRTKKISDVKSILIIVILLCVVKSEYINTFAKETIDVAIAYFNKEEDNFEEIKQPKVNSKEEQIKFTIEYPEGHPLIRNEELEELYNCLFYTNENDLNEIIKSKIKIWLNSCKINISLDKAVTSSGKSTEYYSNIEEGFSNENGARLSSDLLDEVISGRKELFDSYPNGTLSWLLANHMQTYDLNYENQTGAKESILYFYMKSIEYTQKSLEFEMDKETKYVRIRYLHSRYKDIAECVNIDKDIRLHAYEIYISIQEALEELGTPQN